MRGTRSRQRGGTGRLGGGPAGLGAALGAAWAGDDVVLVEWYGFLGGNATAALVMPLMSHFTQSRPSANPDLTRLLPPDHGPGDAVVAGAREVLLHRLISDGWGVNPVPTEEVQRVLLAQGANLRDLAAS